LAFEIMRFAQEFGLERLGFLTLTFADPVLELKEANRRFNSLNTHVLKGRYRRAVVVPERQWSRRLHFHLLVVLDADIRTGVDFEAFKRRDYRSAGPALRAEWAFWRKTAPAYRFGRTELLPIRSTVEGISRYVGGYIGKHVRERTETDKGARLVRYLGFGPGERKSSCRFGWNTDNGWLWRHKLASFAGRYGVRDTDDLAKIFGPRWAYLLQAAILQEPLHEFKAESYAACERLSAKSLGMEYPVARVAEIQKMLDVRKSLEARISKTYELQEVKLWKKKEQKKAAAIV
jgi:hypothetical protein